MSASGDLTAGIGGNASTGLNYFIEFIGAPGTIQVDVQASGSVSVPTNSFASGGSGSVSLLVSGTPDIPINVVACSACIFGGPSFSINGLYTFNANEIYQVQMSAILSGIYGGSASAFIDPMFTAPIGYTFEISPNIGNSTGAVPEPSTWAMMILGFAGIGFMAYRKRALLLKAA